jgi:hypothetical protein
MLILVLLVVLECVDVSALQRQNKIIAQTSDLFSTQKLNRIEEEHDDEDEHESSTPVFRFKSQIPFEVAASTR